MIDFDQITHCTILLVDDNPLNLEVLSDYLVKVGFTIRVAQDGERALRMVQKELPDLILLDVQMPGLDGFQVCQKLKEQEATRGVPVIFMTALDETEDKIKGFSVGGVDYLTKPLQREEMLARIQTHLTIRKLQQQFQEQNTQLQTSTEELLTLNIQLHQEIENHKRAEQALRESEQRFRNVITHDADAILVVDKNNIVRFVNPAAKTLFELSNGDDATLLGKQFALPATPGKATEFEIPHRDGENRVVEIRTVEIEWDQEQAYLESLRDITEHKHLEEALRKSQHQLAVMYKHEQERRRLSDTLREVAKIVSSTLEQQEVVKLVLQQLEYVVTYHRATVALLEGNTLTIVAGQDKMGGNVLNIAYPAARYPLNTQVLEEKRPLCLPDVRSDPRWQPTKDTEAIRSFILAPLLFQEQPIGTLSVGRQDDIPYTDDDAQTVFTFASQVALSLHNARLHARMQERNRRLALLHEISLAVNSTLDLPTLLTAACQKLVETFHADHSGVVFFDESCTYGEVVAEFPTQNAVGIHIPLAGYTSTERMIQTAQPEMIDDAQHDPDMEKVWEIMRSLGIQSLLIVPLILKGSVIGSFSLDVTTAKRCFSFSEITLAQTIASQLAMAVANARLLEKERERIEQELETAQQLQISLLPVNPPKIRGLSLASFSEPARVVGGDFYNFFVFDQEDVGIGVGDVAGKGLQAALMMSLSFGLLTSEVRRDIRPAELLALLNTAIHPHTQRNWMNIALTYATLRAVTSAASGTWEITIANAGLVAPLFRRADGAVVCLDVRGLPLGMTPDIIYEEQRYLLAPGDLLVLSSDGVIEATNEAEKLYGIERLTACVAASSSENAQTVLDDVLRDVQAFIGDTETHDDLTVVVIRVDDP